MPAIMRYGHGVSSASPHEIQQLLLSCAQVQALMFQFENVVQRSNGWPWFVYEQVIFELWTAKLDDDYSLIR
jgi:hypothetical protein